MHSSRMRTTRLYPVYLEQGSSQSPLDADPYGHVNSDACLEANPHRCKNIALPQLRLRAVDI